MPRIVRGNCRDGARRASRLEGFSEVAAHCGRLLGPGPTRTAARATRRTTQPFDDGLDCVLNPRPRGRHWSRCIAFDPQTPHTARRRPMRSELFGTNLESADDRPVHVAEPAHAAGRARRGGDGAAGCDGRLPGPGRLRLPGRGRHGEVPQEGVHWRGHAADEGLRTRRRLLRRRRDGDPPRQPRERRPDSQRQQRPRLRLHPRVGHQAGRGRVDDGRRRLQHHVHRHRAPSPSPRTAARSSSTSTRPTYADIQAAVAWSTSLTTSRAAYGRRRAR